MKSLLFLLALTIFFGCNNNDDEFLPLTIAPTLIGNGNLYGNGEENITKQNLIISRNNEWTELMSKMNTVNNETDNFTETEIDFSNFILLAVFDEIKRNGGYTVAIKNVVENKNDLTVTIQHLAPNGRVSTVITQPYHIVKIHKTEKKIIFNEI
jgi:hypothetical protein